MNATFPPTTIQQSAIDAWAFDAILSKDLQGRITSWNLGAQNLYGYTEAEAVGQHVSLLVPPHKRAEFDDVMRRIQQGQRVEPFETQRKRKDGEVIDVSLTVSPILNDAGEIVAASSIARDITRQKRAERALAVSERRYRDLYDNAPDMYASLDAANAVIVDCNETLTRVLGWPRVELIGRPVWDLYHPGSLESARRAFRAFQDDGEVRDRELRLVRVDGAPLDVSLSVTAVRDSKGKIVQSRSVWRDISDRKEVARQRAASQLRLQSIVQSALDAIISMDQGGVVTAWNSQAEATFGYTAEEACGRPLAELIVPKRLRKDHRKGLVHFLHTGEGPVIGKRVNVPAMHKDGHEFPVELTIAANEVGGAYEFCGFVRDITERVRADEEIRRQVRQREQFFAVLSHELRNPLGALLGAVEVLESCGRHSEAASDATDVIGRQARQMASLLDDLLDVARISRNKLVYRKAVVSLESIARDAVQGIQHAVAQKQQRLAVTVDGGPLVVWGDEARLQQVQANLLSNAAKYTPAGGSIELILGRDGDQGVITVRDTGQGITPALLGQVFELFVQSDESLDRSEGGMGLGLAITRSIVQAHEGTITVHSAGAGQGSEFTVRLPLTDKQPARRKRAIHQPSFAGRRLLLAEDNADARRMLAQILRQRGFDVCEAADGRQAIALFDSHAPDVAVIDIGLPEIDGHEVARAIRRGKHGGGAVLLALTGYGGRSDLLASEAAGFDEHLVKPLDLTRLFALLAEKLGQPAST